MHIDNKSLDAFRDDFQKAVKELEKKYEVTVSLGRITYSENQFHARVTVDNGTDPEVIASNQFDKDVWKFEDIGLKPGMYNQIVVGPDNEKYVLKGFIPNAKKYPIEVMRLRDGNLRVAERNFIYSILNEKYVDIVS